MQQRILSTGQTIAMFAAAFAVIAAVSTVFAILSLAVEAPPLIAIVIQGVVIGVNAFCAWDLFKYSKNAAAMTLPHLQSYIGQGPLEARQIIHISKELTKDSYIVPADSIADKINPFSYPLWLLYN